MCGVSSGLSRSVWNGPGRGGSDSADACSVDSEAGGVADDVGLNWQETKMETRDRMDVKRKRIGRKVFLVDCIQMEL